MEFLLARQATDVLAGYNAGWTLLHYAAFFGETDCLRTLLARGDPVDPLLVPDWPVTPLEMSITVERNDDMQKAREDCARLLLDHGARLELLVKQSEIPLWVHEYVRRRAAAHAATVIIGIHKYRHSVMDTNNRDAIQLIAQHTKRCWPSKQLE